MPSQGRESFSPASACEVMPLARSIGIAKPMACAELASAVLMPMTLPLRSRSGPPLLPGLMAASVWIRSSRPPLLTSIDRFRPETTPVVTLFVYSPSGLPIAMTLWPCLRALLSPSGAVGSPVASTLTIAKSVRVSTP